MSSQPSSSSDPVETPSRRVILVGRTGLDAKLRLDSAVELVRVPTGVEALSEIITPLPGGPAGPPVVVVGQDTELDDARASDASTPEDRYAQFTSAARRIDPGVLLFHALPESPRTTASFDGVLSPENTAIEVKALLDRAKPAASSVPDTPAVLPPGESFSKPENGPSGSDRARPGVVADEELVRAVLRGVAIDQIASDLIAERLGVDGVRLLPAEAVTPDQRAGGLWVPVSHDGRLLGHLTADVSDSEPPNGPGLAAAFVDQAAWLAPWLALAEQHRRLRIEAFTDTVTGAWNRRYFDRFIRTALDHARANRHNLTVMVFDIDNFKTFNDRFGHDAGDEVLAETVRLLKSTIRPTDRVCRIGGDEFAVVFYEPDGPRQPGSDHPSGLSQVAKRFQQKINDQTFPKLGVDARGELTISGGLATFPWDGRSAEELVARADQLAIQSKRSGKNAITFGPNVPTRQPSASDVGD
ncbi:MAG: GGDEF domain-containing protein [Planctomycetota bacterium]